MEIPSFFNRTDFIGKLLPGYVLITLYLFLFEKDYIFNLTSEQQFNLLTIIVFIIAGPVFGYTIMHFHRSIPYIKLLFASSDRKNEMEIIIACYSVLKTKMSIEDKNELDYLESELDFTNSTLIVLVILELLLFYTNYIKSDFDILYNIVLIALIITLAILSYSLKKLSLIPFIYVLFIKYDLYLDQDDF